MSISFETTLIGTMDLGIEEATLRMQTSKAFDRVFNAGKRNRFLAKIFKKEIHLQTLASLPIESHRSSSHIVTVPIRNIKGSLDRSEDFDTEFHPLNVNSRSRWMSIATAVRKGIPMPAVELVQVGENYYVRDGHHRISVAKDMEQEAVEAMIVN